LKPSGRLCAAIPHPLNTAGAFQSRDATAPFVITGSYLDSSQSTMVVNRGGIRLTFHSEHRSLEVYFRALETAGLLTETLREVKTVRPGREPRPGRTPLAAHSTVPTPASTQIDLFLIIII